LTGEFHEIQWQVGDCYGSRQRIGKHLALAFAREGAAVAVADLNPVAADAVAAEIEAAGGQALGVAMDVTMSGRSTRGSRP